MNTTSTLAVRAALAAAGNARAQTAAPIREAAAADVAPPAAPVQVPGVPAPGGRTIRVGGGTAAPGASRDRVQGWSYEFDRRAGG